MYILKFFDRNEIEQMTISKSVDKLIRQAELEIGKSLIFKDFHGVLFIYSPNEEDRNKDEEIGVICEIQEIE
jgi:hypothetical protein